MADMNDKYACLKLDNQLCFPLYAASKEVVRKYKPLLDELDLTYTQYITMMVMWENKKINVKDLGERLFLDSGTLTPVLKKLEEKGYVTRTRSKEDERVLDVAITKKGVALKDEAIKIPHYLNSCLELSHEESFQLYTLLNKFLGQLKEEK